MVGVGLAMVLLGVTAFATLSAFCIGRPFTAETIATGPGELHVNVGSGHLAASERAVRALGRDGIRIRQRPDGM